MKIRNILLALFFVGVGMIAIKAPAEARHAHWNVGFNFGGAAPLCYQPVVPVYQPIPVYRAPVYAPAPVVVYPAPAVYEQVYVYPSRPICRSHFGFGFSFGR